MLDALIDDAGRVMRGALVLVILAAGGWLTFSAARFGLAGALAHGCSRPISHTTLRLKATSDAIIQFEIENARCPKDIAELVDGRFLDRGNGKDPWGAPIRITCAAVNEACVARSAGPDLEFGTADDITFSSAR